MRFHSDILTASTVAKIVQGTSGPYINTATDHRSRSRKGAVELKLFGSSSRYPNFGRNDNYDMAATWDEWGVVIGKMFEIDPEMTCRNYDGAEDFHHQTGDRFRNGNLPLEDRHNQHRWTYVNGDFKCKCGSITRRGSR